MPCETLLNNIAELAKNRFKPLVEDVDHKGLYPRDFLRNLGAIGGFVSVSNAEESGTGYGLAAQIAVLRKVAKEYDMTSFGVWYQAAYTWHLHRSPNPEVEEKCLAGALQGGILADTGMSNTVEHLTKIEKHSFQTVRADGGYAVNGTLPQVPNIGEEHTRANAAQADSGYMIFVADEEQNGVSLQNYSKFCVLEGTRTCGLTSKDVFVEDGDVIATPEQFVAYIQNVKAGFIPLQISIGAGVIDGSLEVIREADAAHAEANRYPGNDYDNLKAKLNGTWVETEWLADLTWSNRPDSLATLRLRAAASELALATSQSAVLHARVKGCLIRSPVQCRPCGAMFVATITPALKHLHEEIAAWEGD